MRLSTAARKLGFFVASFGVGVLVGRDLPWLHAAGERQPVAGSEPRARSVAQLAAAVDARSEKAPASVNAPALPESAPARAHVVNDDRRALPGKAANGTNESARPQPLSWGQVAARAQQYTAAIRADQNYGAGIVIAPSGLVITNMHVIEGAKSISVGRLGLDNAPAQLLDSDATLDLALLEVKAPGAAAAASSGAVAAPFGMNRAETNAAPGAGTGHHRSGSGFVASNRALEVGDEVLAVGSPRKMHFSVSRGMISFSNRLLDGVEYIQTDLPINVGNSGGPLVDREGHVIGVVSFILRDSQGISFALPIERALQRFASQLFPTGVPADVGAGVSAEAVAAHPAAHAPEPAQPAASSGGPR